MSHSLISSYPLTPADSQSAPGSFQDDHRFGYRSNAALAAAITRDASVQTFFTIRYLADRPLAADAYRAYAYFRWVDDVVDQAQLTRADRLAFLARQQEIMARCYQGERPSGLCPEERLVVDLVHGDQAANSGLHIYINQMMAVMAFDAQRRGRLVSQAELDEYTRALATAVTEALHYFIGHNDSSPQDEARYLAVTGAHVTHMLRDAVEDTAVGYYNLPREFLEAHRITPNDVNHDAYRAWVQNRVQLARRCFAAGRANLMRVENLRCRLAGYAYIGRFELVLDAIEKDGFRLRAAYPERKSKKAGLKMALAALSQTLRSAWPRRRTLRAQSIPVVEIAK